jgi:ATP-dependent protease ClpP protease subunit
MENEISLYGSIETYSSEYIINQMNRVKGSDISLRINSVGGNVFACYGIIAKFKEFTGNKEIKIDGTAYSMAAFFCAYSNSVQALDVSEFMIHRAAYPSYIESNPELFTAEKKERLNKVNQDLRAALESKIDVEKFEKLKGVSIDDLFSIEAVKKDVYLTASEALEIGLIDSINEITPEQAAAISENYDIAAKYNSEADLKSIYRPETVTGKINNSKTKNPKKMDLETLKKDHPEVHAQAAKEGTKEAKESAIKAEKERIQALLELREADPELIDAKIADGSNLTQAEVIKLTKAIYAKDAAKDVEKNAADDLKTKSPESKISDDQPTAEEQEYADYEAKIDAALDIK